MAERKGDTRWRISAGHDLADPGDAEFMRAFHRIHDPDYRQLILDMVKGLNRVGNGKALDGQGNGDEVGH